MGDERRFGPALRVRGVCKRFGRNQVVDDVSLTVEPGELVALVGENGAGKSTLVRCIAGQLHPDRGHIAIGDDTTPGRGDLLGVVWQDLALCDNLDVVANLFLGRELSNVVLHEAAMHASARQLLASLDIEIDDLHRLAGQLSGGQRQGVAIARALVRRPPVLVLDEPTSALGVAESATVIRLVRRLRAEGVAILLVSHNLEHVFALADRIVVMRHGRVAADVTTSEVHPDDVVALITGAATDSAARKQLHQLRSLVDQLAEVQPAASLPLIVSALSAALKVDRLCVHLVEATDASDDEVLLVRRAAVGLPARLAALVERLPLGARGGLVGAAGEHGGPIVVDDLRTRTSALDAALVDNHVLSAWAIPIVGAGGLLGVVSAYADHVGTPSDPQLELAALYANLAASAIEREHLLDEVTRRNRILESLRGMLDGLAGPAPSGDDLGVALLPLCAAIDARAVAIYDTAVTPPGRRAGVTATAGPIPADVEHELLHAAELAGKRGDDRRAQRVDPSTVVVPLTLPTGTGALVATWPAGAADALGDVTFDLLDDAARTLGLAIERQSMEDERKESSALRRSSVLQRDFLMRLSHELRTPLTAIHGYASTLRQTDVEWDQRATDEFLARIEGETARMGRLVADLLDSSVIETGGLRLQADWCDVGLIVDQAVSLVPDLHGVRVDIAPALPAVWADHDRLEQVIVNLLGNAAHHGAAPVTVTVHATNPGAAPPLASLAPHQRPAPWRSPVRPAEPHSAGGAVTIDVCDAGPGITDEAAERAFEPYVAGNASRGAGIGLAIVRGIVEAHGGTVRLGRLPAGGTRARVTLPIEPATQAVVNA